MKILIFYTYNKGLLSNFFQELSKKLAAEGNDVFNFFLKHKTDSFVQDNVHLFEEKRGGYLKNYYNVYKIIKRTNPDVVLSNFSYVNPALLFGRYLGVKRNMVWFHTVYGHSKPARLKILIKRVFLEMADMVIANSKILQLEMNSVYKVPKTKTCAISFWTNISNFCGQSTGLTILQSDNEINIGCPGRLVEDKNHALVIEALYQLKQSSEKPIRLYIAGDGPYRTQLEKMVQKLHLEQDVVFMGLLNVEQMVAFYDAMDVVILPSFHEAFGLVFIEALALGTPVLVSNAFGALDFIDPIKFPKEEFSFNPQTVQELIDKINPYLRNAGKKSSYFESMYAETFNKEVIFNQIKAVILDQPMSS